MLVSTLEDHCSNVLVRVHGTADSMNSPLYGTVGAVMMTLDDVSKNPTHACNVQDIHVESPEEA